MEKLEKVKKEFYNREEVEDIMTEALRRYNENLKDLILQEKDKEIKRLQEQVRSLNKYIEDLISDKNKLKEMFNGDYKKPRIKKSLTDIEKIVDNIYEEIKPCDFNDLFKAVKVKIPTIKKSTLRVHISNIKKRQGKVLMWKKFNPMERKS